MAKFVLTNASFKINGVDLSDHVREITIDAQVKDIDDTTMGATGMGHLAGLRDEKVTVKWAQDFAAAKVDATLWPIYIAGADVAASVWANGTTSSSTNPSYSGNLLLQSYQPLAGQVGVLAESQTTFMVDGVLTRATV